MWHDRHDSLLPSGNIVLFDNLLLSERGHGAGQLTQFAARSLCLSKTQQSFTIIVCELISTIMVITNANAARNRIADKAKQRPRIKLKTTAEVKTIT